MSCLLVGQLRPFVLLASLIDFRTGEQMTITHIDVASLHPDGLLL
jgi:hypothetical protein